MTRSPAPEAAPGYDRTTRLSHWLVAMLAAVVVVLGWWADGTPRNAPSRNLLLLLHRSIGMTILALMLWRALRRWRHPPPPAPPHLGRGERLVARLTHFLLYLIFLLMPLAGWANAAATGHPVSLYGVVSIPPILPENGRLSQLAIMVHLVGQYALYLLVALHVAAALYHGIVRRDGVLERMLNFR